MTTTKLAKLEAQRAALLALDTSQYGGFALLDVVERIEQLDRQIAAAKRAERAS